MVQQAYFRGYTLTSTVNPTAHVVKLHPGYKKSDRNHQEPKQGESEKERQGYSSLGTKILIIRNHQTPTGETEGGNSGALRLNMRIQ